MTPTFSPFLGRWSTDSSVTGRPAPLTTTRSESSAPLDSKVLWFLPVTFLTMSTLFWTISLTLLSESAFDLLTAWKNTPGLCDVARLLG